MSLADKENPMDSLASKTKNSGLLGIRQRIGKGCNIMNTSFWNISASCNLRCGESVTDNREVVAYCVGCKAQLKLLDEIEGEMKVEELDINERLGVLRPSTEKLPKALKKFDKMSKADTLEELKKTCAEADLFAYGGYLVGRRLQIQKMLGVDTNSQSTEKEVKQ